MAEANSTITHREDDDHSRREHLVCRPVDRRRVGYSGYHVSGRGTIRPLFSAAPLLELDGGWRSSWVLVSVFTGALRTRCPRCPWCQIPSNTAFLRLSGRPRTQVHISSGCIVGPRDSMRAHDNNTTIIRWSSESNGDYSPSQSASIWGDRFIWLNDHILPSFPP